jgi:hypothetical protein
LPQLLIAACQRLFFLFQQTPASRKQVVEREKVGFLLYSTTRLKKTLHCRTGHTLEPSSTGVKQKSVSRPLFIVNHLPDDTPRNFDVNSLFVDAAIAFVPLARIWEMSASSSS